MNKPNDSAATEHTVPRDEAIEAKVIKKPFVEPSVSVPIEVLEATTFFQAPTIESSTV